MGVAYRPSDRWLIAFDATWIEWSDFLGDWVVNLSNGDNEDINAIIGSSGFSDRTPQNWKNGVIFSLGIEHALTKKSILRAGFAHGNSIVPSDTIHLLGPAISEDHLTLGYGYHWKSFEFNLAYEHIFRNSSSPVTQHRLARWFDNSKVSASADILHTMYTWYF
jgi:long-chain fatty acid transport protein